MECHPIRVTAGLRLSRHSAALRGSLWTRPSAPCTFRTRCASFPQAAQRPVSLSPHSWRRHATLPCRHPAAAPSAAKLRRARRRRPQLESHGHGNAYRAVRHAERKHQRYRHGYGCAQSDAVGHGNAHPYQVGHSIADGLALNLTLARPFSDDVALEDALAQRVALAVADSQGKALVAALSDACGRCVIANSCSIFVGKHRVSATKCLRVSADPQWP